MVEAQRNAGGRPREFDEGLALDGAIEAFWRLGYEGASMAELTQAMGINRGLVGRRKGGYLFIAWKLMNSGTVPRHYV